MEKLELHMNKSRRILNDLRSLRRLLFEERTAKPASAPHAKIETQEPDPASTAPQEIRLSSTTSKLIA
jgi:hypothetical protein